MAQPDPIRVAVAGGGMAGMTAALRLCQRGYAVTLYERKPWLGGNMGSAQGPGGGMYHDVYPHMFSNFYVNFWDIVCNELGLKRDASEESDFSPRDVFKTVSPDGRYSVMKNAATLDPRALWDNMLSAARSGMSPLEVYLCLYSVLDLITHRFDLRWIAGLDLDAFIRSRPTATEQTANLHDAIVMFVWSIHADAAAASSYRSFYRMAFGNVRPLLWLLKGSLAEKVVLPLERRLLALGCTIRKGASVERVVLSGRRVSALELKRAEFDWDTQRVRVTDEPLQPEPFDHVVLAVSPGGLGALADAGGNGHRLSERLPRLTHVDKRLPVEPIAVMDLVFTRKLEGLPAENVSAVDSDCYFSFVDLSQLWPQLQAEGITAVTLAASDYWALPSDNDDDNAHHLISEFARYVKAFDPGEHWGDANSDIDWQRTHYRSNQDDAIFVNQAGTWEYRPETHHSEVENLFFASDFCRNAVDMATVEAAVTSGIAAAAAVQAASPRGAPIEMLAAPLVPHAALVALKLLLAPPAYACKAWLTSRDLIDQLGPGGKPELALQDWTTLVGLPAAYAADMVNTLGSAWGGAQT